MSLNRLSDGEFLFLNHLDVNVIIAEYDADCELLDIECPTLEAWLLAKLHDTRQGIA